MFVSVGRFTFNAMDDGERQQLAKRIEADVRAAVEGNAAFRGLYAAQPTENEVLMVWLWDDEAAWEKALVDLGPALQEYVLPNLALPPERVGGEVVVEIS